MFQKFSHEARRVVVLAQEESRLLEHDYIGTEHLLLALARRPTALVEQVFAAVDVDHQVILDQVVAIVGKGEGWTPGHIPFTPRAKKVLEMSLRESLALNASHIGPEHILLGIVAEGEGIAAQVLEAAGVRHENVREVVAELADDEGPVQPVEALVTPVSRSGWSDQSGPLVAASIVFLLVSGVAALARPLVEPTASIALAVLIVGTLATGLAIVARSGSPDATSRLSARSAMVAAGSFGIASVLFCLSALLG
jgi:hypothetical protein